MLKSQITFFGHAPFFHFLIAEIFLSPTFGLPESLSGDWQPLAALNRIRLCEPYPRSRSDPKLITGNTKKKCFVLNCLSSNVLSYHKFDMFRHFKQTCFISTNLFIIVDVCCWIWSLDGVDNVHNFLYVKLQLLSDDYRETWWERSFVWDSSDLKTFKLKSSIEVFDCINWQKW